MSITHESFQVFGSHVYDEQITCDLIDAKKFEEKINNLFGIILNEGDLETLKESGTNEEEINYQEYASEYSRRPFLEYEVLMVFQHGNFIIDKRNVAVGFVVDLNRDSFEKIEQKKTIFIQELQDFKIKTGYRTDQPKHQSLVSVL